MWNNPPGFEDDRYPDHVYKLSKALYGLKQALRAWYECLRDFLITNAFKVGKADPSIFTNVTEPPKLLGPPTVVLVQQTSDNPVDVPESLDKFGIFSLTFPGTFHPSDRQYVHRRCGNAEVIT